MIPRKRLVTSRTKMRVSRAARCKFLLALRSSDGFSRDLWSESGVRSQSLGARSYCKSLLMGLQGSGGLGPATPGTWPSQPLPKSVSFLTPKMIDFGVPFWGTFGDFFESVEPSDVICSSQKTGLGNNVQNVHFWDPCNVAKV